ncbi:HD-GYP domain-containing protein [Desulfobacter latus]|uniref:HD domain-containing protein n=1 Tax=Desulfobacter latus TaxID=2292 RepID=A0A850STX0_9BACT|nr:HD domain-containing phosphohydrolase [Desulfobacter latus]NWH03460.1 HD domain-containing protein [Desulfobacter latus]
MDKEFFNKFSENIRLGKLVHSIVTDVKTYAQEQIENIKKLSEVGMALSVEKDMNRLFEMILNEARRFCRAEAGTLYILDREKQSLKFEVCQNDRINIGMEDQGQPPIQLPDVPLYINNQPNHSNVSSHAALNKSIVNLPDIYNLADKVEYRDLSFKGTMKYDRITGFQTRSMLVIPMKNHEDRIIGVLQLINARDEETGEIIPFSEEILGIVSSLASQAAVALTNTQLISELKALLHAFIKSIATAIDEKSAYTGGHIRRVVELTRMMAEDINASKSEAFKDVCLSEAQLEELHMAAWMHDVGKITTPEFVMDKSTKLETIFDRIDLVKTRFELIKEGVKNKYAEEMVKFAVSRRRSPGMFEQLEMARDKKILEIQNDFEFIEYCNDAKDHMSDENIERIKDIGRKTYMLNGEEHPFLTKNEIRNLCIRKGTLTESERKQIENHAKMTFDIISQLPFPENLAHVAEYAASHHEKLDGSGYPQGLDSDTLPLQSRIIAIADIFEALTAKDRPYKTPMPLSQSLKILEFMKKDNHIDSDILELFIKNRRFLEYAEKEMNPEQIDIECMNF